MRAIQNADGHVGLTAREYPIAAGTAVKRGQVVQLSGGKVISAVAAQTGDILGLAAENHSGSADVLNPRSNGEMILVYDNPTLIFECPAPEITAVSGSATTLLSSGTYVDSTIADDAFNGGYLQLKAKAAGSTNTDRPGQIREITDYAKASFTFTLPSGAAAVSGDIYRVYPPVGFTACALDSGAVKALVSGTGATAVRVVGHDTQRGMLRLMAAAHALGV